MSAPNPWSMPATTKPTAPPRTDAYTTEALNTYDGTVKGATILVAVKDSVFDVTPNSTLYSSGAKYGVFAGKHATKALAISSMKEEDCVPVDDESVLTKEQKEKLDGWYKFFEDRYNIVGKMIKGH